MSEPDGMKNGAYKKVKMIRLSKYTLFITAIFFLLTFTPVQAEDDEGPVVHAVLFYSTTCGHCSKVINEVLTPLIKQYGNQLSIVGINTQNPNGQVLFQEAFKRFDFPGDHLAVPTLIIDDVVLVGSVEIPQKFPSLVEKYLAQGGIDWPDIPGLDKVLEDTQPTRTPEHPTPTATRAQPTTLLTNTPVATLTPTDEPAPGLIIVHESSNSIRDRFLNDPLGNALAIFVLIGMVSVVGGTAFMIQRPMSRSISTWQEWAVPLLCVIGLGVASYLAYVETAQVTAVCGPVGDCNTVQQSEYAKLFGVIHIGVMGVVGYVVILVTWAISYFAGRKVANLASLGLVGLTLFGTLFSIYLTFLEPFVIGATCAWCLMSAILMTALFILSTVNYRSKRSRDRE
jgi:uncharacterized membrane protein